MKNFILGILTITLFQGSLNYTNYYLLDHDSIENKNIYDKYHKPIFYTLEYLKFSPVIHVITKRCTKDTWDFKREITARQWFSCNKIQIFFSDLLY